MATGELKANDAEPGEDVLRSPRTPRRAEKSPWIEICRPKVAPDPTATAGAVRSREELVFAMSAWLRRGEIRAAAAAAAALSFSPTAAVPCSRRGERARGTRAVHGAAVSGRSRGRRGPGSRTSSELGPRGSAPALSPYEPRQVASHGCSERHIGGVAAGAAPRRTRDPTPRTLDRRRWSR
jgi:hypothetical protein